MIDKPKKKSAELSNENVEAGTPPNAVRLAHYTMGGREAVDAYDRGDAENGGVDLDVASSAYWNFHLVRARRFLTKEDNALTKIWRARRVFINPPGTTDDDRIQGSIPRLFWQRAIEFRDEGILGCFFYVGFNMSQLQVIQQEAQSPLHFLTNFPGARLDYYEKPWEWIDDPRRRRHKTHTDGCEGDPCTSKCRMGKLLRVKRELSGPPRNQGAPPRPSFITFVPPKDNAIARPMVERFLEGADYKSTEFVPGIVVRPVFAGRRAA